ncbi:MAG TPA: hypothetical protein VMV73_06170 [Candidatus Dormibacteraeota bacterium]|nr:hypothetical protein [Candidatus Dormibacteraeota bacterium]
MIAKETAPAPQSASEVLLARLGIRATPATIAAAERAQSAPRQIAAVFSQAEALLSRYVAQPAVAAARNLLNFVAALDPEHPATLPQQLAAYVETVLGGTETKLTALVSALAETENQMPTGTAALPTASAEQAATPPVSGHSPPAVPSALPTAAPAVSPAHDAGVVIAQSSLAQDVKSTLLAMANDPQSAAIPGASAILNDAALTISAAQMHLLAANLNSDPRTLIVPIPVFFREGGAATELRIGRERSGAGERMTADNFHLGFLLDTTSLGTVAIDLETSGRRVSVRVKTERDGAAARFRTAFDSLRGRLEFLRYRVASMQAAVAARALVRPAEPPPAPVKSSASPSVDASA